MLRQSGALDEAAVATVLAAALAKDEYDLVLFTVLHKGQVLDKNGEQDG